MPHRDLLAGNRWVFRCEHCDHSYRAPAQNRLHAELYAHVNGWATEPRTLCPGCATLFVHEDRPGVHPPASGYGDVHGPLARTDSRCAGGLSPN